MEKEPALDVKREFFEQVARLKRVGHRRGMSLELRDSEAMLLLQTERLVRGNSGEGVKPSELTGGGFISKPMVSRLLGSLEEKGCISRTASRRDRREVYVRITEHGRQCLERERKYRDAMVGRVLDRMGKERLEQLVILMKELNACAEAEARLAGERKRTRENETEGDGKL